MSKIEKVLQQNRLEIRALTDKSELKKLLSNCENGEVLISQHIAEKERRGGFQAHGYFKFHGDDVNHKPMYRLIKFVSSINI